MSMRYKAYFSYFVQDGDDIKYTRLEFPIDSFEVAGGAERFIAVKSTDDIGITSELEQARAFKNITLFLPPRKDGSDMEAALELTEMAWNELTLNVMVTIQRYSNGRLLEGLALLDRGAKLKKPPYTVPKQLLMVEISIPTAHLFRGKISHTHLTDHKEF